jgi:hypothetical protein
MLLGVEDQSEEEMRKRGSNDSLSLALLVRSVKRRFID